MDQEPIFVLSQNINTFNTLKGWLYNPPVFFVLFAWVMATIVSVKNVDAKPFKWILVLTISLIIFKVLPLQNTTPAMTQEQITQVATQVANMNRLKAIPTGTPSAQLIGN